MPLPAAPRPKPRFSLPFNALALSAFLWLATESFGFAATYPSLPENPAAFGHCMAKVKVAAARLRKDPSLDAKVVGLRYLADSLRVFKVQGKWVQVELSQGDTAYMAAYLLAFPFNELLEQWKRETPAPSVGKKAKVKWAAVNYRAYPSAGSARMGRLLRGDEVAVLSDAGHGWALVESLSEDGKPGCYGFVPKRALAAPDLPDPEGWRAPLAKLKRDAATVADPARESPSEYLARTAWSPRLFALEIRAQQGRPLDEVGEGMRLAALH